MCALRVLMLEDRAEDAELLALALHRDGIECEWTRVQTRSEFLSGLREGPDIVLSDYSLPGFNALEALAIVTETRVETPVIVVTGAMSEETCVESLRHGASDYLLKDRLARLGPAVKQAMADQKLRISRREAEQASERLGATLRGVVNNSPSAIFVKDREGRYLIANRRLEEMLGLPADSATGLRDRDLLPAPIADALAALDGDCIAANRPRQHEEEFGDGADRRSYLSVRYPISGDGEATDAIGGIYTDITAMKRIENDIRVARAELRNQAAHLEQDNLDLRELDHVKAEFLQSVSHELRTPLSIINGTVEMMLEGDFGQLSTEERELVATVEKAGDRLDTTIIDLLTVFQMDRGGFAVNLRPTQLSDIIARATHAVGPMLDNAGIRAEIDIPQELPSVSVDGDQITRVLINLVTNAIKFSPSDTTITISAHPHSSEVVVAVRDAGAGIPKAEQSQIFLRFHRGSAAVRESMQGAGLGLAISKEIVERQRGWIDLESDEHRGTTVSFGLPLDVDRSIEHRGEVRIPLSGGPPGPSDGANQTIRQPDDPAANTAEGGRP